MKSPVGFAALVAPILMTAAWLGVANASGPIGVYALVDKVILEPSADKPERIRISGVFITSKETPDNSTVYGEPQRGNLYFRLPKGSNEDLARREWADLKSIAGTRQVVGLGTSWGPKVHVTTSNSEAASPAEFPIGNGVVKINSDQPRAKELLDYKDR